MSSYAAELTKLAESYANALRADSRQLQEAISGACESSIIAVGNGGSYTVAALLCHLHEHYTGRVSRSATSLEIICNPTLAAASPIFLVSAEGKNPDIVEALYRARRHSSRPIHVLTNRSESPLTQALDKITDVTTHLHVLPSKDGYLATNSLLFNASLVARAYVELNRSASSFPTDLSGLQIGGQSLDAWLGTTNNFVDAATRTGNLLIIYSPLLRPIATDLESRLAESALLYSQLCDLRSLAHGRHLWFSHRPTDCTVLALLEPSLVPLWNAMESLLPPEVAKFRLMLDGSEPQHLLSGLVGEMHLVQRLAAKQGKNIGQPEVPDFGRELYYIEVSSLIPTPAETGGDSEESKYNSLGARWPSIERRGRMQRALAEFESAVSARTFKGIVCDYDGTLCVSQRKDQPPSPEIVDHLTRLLQAGVVIGIASGRGDSLLEQLRKGLQENLWPDVFLALYSGGCLMSLADSLERPNETSDFLSHVERVVRRLQTLGVPIDVVRTTQPYQVSVRFRPGIQTEGMWFVVADALRQEGLSLSQIVRSKHSIDILAHGVDKSHIIDHLVHRLRVDPYDIVTFGDQGAWPGNDSSLLDHRFSLSVDAPNRRLDRGWKLAPSHKRDVDAMLWYLERIEIESHGRFRIKVGPR